MTTLHWDAKDLNGIQAEVFADGVKCSKTYLIDLVDLVKLEMSIVGLGSVKGYKTDNNGNVLIDPWSTSDNPFASEYEYTGVGVEIKFENERDLSRVFEVCSR